MDESKHNNSQGANIHKPKKPYLYILAFIVLAGLVWLGASNISRDQNQTAAELPCSDTAEDSILLQTAATFNLEGQQFRDALGEKVEQITAIEGYQQDPNCVYPVAIYYINMSNAAKAEEALADYENVYADDSSVSGVYPYRHDPSILRGQIEHIKLTEQEAIQNAITIPMVPEEEVQ